MRRVAVIGAGVMGAGIAAQVANAGVSVRLLDRTGVAAASLARMAKDPAPFMSRSAVARITPGDSDADLAAIGDCDWILEAVVERLDVKQALYRRVEAVRRPGSAVSSNTSTIRLQTLLDGLPAPFARDFCITHFFNPPRQMRLLELVAGPAADPALLARVTKFIEVAMGKTAVACHDTPGFIANRIGTFWLQLGMNAARDLGLTVEEADAVLGKPAGIPKTGVFGLLDLIGIDLMPALTGSLAAALPAADAFQAALRPWPLLDRLIAEGRTGRKGGGGFYRIERGGGGTTRQALDLATGEYRPEQPVDIAERDLAALLTAPGPRGDYARKVLGGTLAYAATLVPEVADDVVAVDTAMQLGYGWKRGPFAMIDAIGAAAFAALAPGAPTGPFYRSVGGRRQQRAPDGSYRPIGRQPGVLLLADCKTAAAPLLHNGSAALWDIGDGVACFEMSSKMGSLDRAILDLLQQTVTLVSERFRALVIGHDGEHFSAGANLAKILAAADAGDWDDIEALIAAGQAAFQALKYAPFPVVAAPFGLALGGGCELALHADAIQAHAELTIGLVECSVGLIPGWGGCGEILTRRLDMAERPAVTQVFEHIRTATVSLSAEHARELGFLRAADGITMNRDRLLADAHARALALADGYRPPEPPVFHLPGRSGLETLLAGLADQPQASEHDRMVATALAEVLTGGAEPPEAVPETALLALERRGFLNLVRTGPTRARIGHTLATGKPLRN